MTELCHSTDLCQSDGLFSRCKLPENLSGEELENLLYAIDRLLISMLVNCDRLLFIYELFIYELFNYKRSIDVSHHIY